MADATLGTAVLRTKLDRSGLKTGLDQAKGDTQKFAADSGAAIRGIGAAFGAIVASQGVRSYISFLRTSANLSQQADAANRLYEKSLQRTNQGLAEGAGLVDRLSTRFGVANSVIESSATLLLRQGASLDDIERALTAAGASAAAAGFDISTAFDNVATAVATGRSELLETSGIVTNLGPVTQAYAKSIGKTVDELTQQEIIQARVNAIYRETASEIEDVDEILQGLPLAQAEVTKQWRTFREDVGGIAAEVITPLTEGLGKVLGYVNDLPEPVKRAGIAMTGAALGATALATGVTAIRTALTGFQALGLLSFGPAGWIVLGATAVAGLVAVLAGRDDSLEGAVGKANKSLASGDADSLTGALGTVIDKVDGPVKQSLLDLQAELVRTGEVGAEMATKIAEALNQATISQAQTMVDMAAAELETLRNMTLVSTNQATPGELEGPLRDRISRFGRTDLAESLFFDQANNRFSFPPDARIGLGKFDLDIVEALQLANSQLVGISNDHAAAVEAAEKRLADAWTRLTALTNPSVTPPPSDGEGAPGKPSKISERVAALRAELKFLEDEVDHGLAEAATLSERQFNAVDDAVRDLLRLGASESLINALLGERGVFEDQVRDRAKTIAPIIRAVLFDEALRAERDTIDALSAEASRSASVAQQGRESERLASVARAPAIRAEAWDEAWFRERQEIEDQAIRAHNEARVAQQRRESERLAAAARAPLIRAEEWDMSWFEERLELEQMADDLAGQRAVRENRANRERQALFDRALSIYGGGSTSLAGTSAALRTGVTVRDTRAELADSLAGTVTGVTAAFKAGEATIEDVEKAVRAWVAVMPQSTTAINELTEGVLHLAREAEFAARTTNAIQSFDEFPYRPGWNVDLPQAKSDVEFNRGYNPFRERTRDLDRGDGGLADARRINQEREASADRFANTVVNAGFAMGDATIKAIADGDIPGLLRAGLSGAGSILGGANLGSIGFLGGSIGIGALISGGLGILGTIIGVLAGGGSDADQARAEQRRVGNVPAINIRFEVNQSNTYTGGPSQPENEQAFRRQADALFESLYRRYLGPRLARIESRLGIAGA